LQLDCATQCIDDACEYDKQAIAHGSYNPAAVFLDFGKHERVVMRFQLSERAFVVSAYQPAVPGDIGHENGRQTPLDTLALQSSLRWWGEMSFTRASTILKAAYPAGQNWSVACIATKRGTSIASSRAAMLTPSPKISCGLLSTPGY
jgi:hypothetical protein